MLFIGALRTVLIALENSNWPQIFASGCLVILVFNDMLSTSYQVETKHEVNYTMPLMLLDLLNFLLLALALIVISPNVNLFDVQLPKVAAFIGDTTFWVLLFLYWSMLMAWTFISKAAVKQHSARILGQSSVAVLFLCQWAVSFFGFTRAARVGNFVVFFYLIIYLVVIRRKLRQAYP